MAALVKARLNQNVPDWETTTSADSLIRDGSQRGEVGGIVLYLINPLLCHQLLNPPEAPSSDRI